MSIMKLFSRKNINEGVTNFQDTPGAVLVDVREPDEYSGGHIPGSVNVPLSTMAQIRQIAPDTATPLYVYCLSGARSGQAERALKQMGYTNVSNIGGINGYKGPVER